MVLCFKRIVGAFCSPAHASQFNLSPSSSPSTPGPFTLPPLTPTLTSSILDARGWGLRFERRGPGCPPGMRGGGRRRQARPSPASLRSPPVDFFRLYHSTLLASRCKVQGLGAVHLKVDAPLHQLLKLEPLRAALFQPLQLPPPFDLRLEELERVLAYQ